MKHKLNKWMCVSLIVVFSLTISACSNNNDGQKEVVPVLVPNQSDESNVNNGLEGLINTIDENNIITNPGSLQVVVNRKRNLPEDYVPSDLVSTTNLPTCLDDPEINQMRKEAQEALTELFEMADEEIGVKLYARSGYRSYNTQIALYNRYVENNGQQEADKFSAKPGQSEHQTGLTMDITSDQMSLLLSEEFGETKEGKWVAENAYRFGFIIRYPKDKEEITGYMYEPWHLRYLGKDLAKKVYDSGLSLDEYMSKGDKQ